MSARVKSASAIWHGSWTWDEGMIRADVDHVMGLSSTEEVQEYVRLWLFYGDRMSDEHTLRVLGAARARRQELDDVRTSAVELIRAGRAEARS